MTLPPVVLDNGTGSIKCGCAGVSPLPLFVCPSVVGRPNIDAFTLHTLLHTAGFASSNYSVEADRELRAQFLQREVLCGDELMGLRDIAALTFPIKNGAIHNMDAMQELWDYVLRQRMPQILGYSAEATNCLSRSCHSSGDNGSSDIDGELFWLEGRPLLLAEPPNLALRQRCDVMEIFFEEYRFSAIQSIPQGILTLFANGVERGVVVECGEGLTHCTPVFDGFVLRAAQRRVDLGGRAVTDQLSRLQQQHQTSLKRGSSTSRESVSRTEADVASHSTNDIFRRLKERYCYVSVDQNLDQHLARVTNALQRTCVLPDGTHCQLGAERFTAPEVLFNPSLMNVESPGVSAVLWDSIQAADIDVRRALYENIILSGGSTLLPGFGARLAKDMKSLYLTEKLKGDASRMARCPIQVKEPPRRHVMAFIGGTLVAEFSADQPQMWMSRNEYEECGTSAIVARYGPEA